MTYSLSELERLEKEAISVGKDTEAQREAATKYLWALKEAAPAMIADLRKYHAFASLETAYDVNDPVMNKARYDGYLDGIQEGLRRMEKMRDVINSMLEEIKDGKIQSEPINQNYAAWDFHKKWEIDAREALGDA